MKKSILALCALFIFAGCSATEQSAVNSDWKALVGGKTIEADGCVMMFSEDASKLVAKESDGSVDWSGTTSPVWEIVSSTADSAVYKLDADVTGDGLYEYRFKNVKSAGGDIDMYRDGELTYEFTFTF